ncbi:MAG: hypothetical protein K2G12_06750 [Prevotella sp.]|nr:hypothetical protein [Prevotella sp.]
MYVIEISEDKVSHLADTVGKMLHYGGKAMECIEEMRRSDGGRMGFRDEEDERDRMGERGYGRGGRYGMREDDMRHDDYDRMGERYPRDRWDEMPPYMGERRGRSATTGRYMRR